MSLQDPSVYVPLLLMGVGIFLLFSRKNAVTTTTASTSFDFEKHVKQCRDLSVNLAAAGQTEAAQLLRNDIFLAIAKAGMQINETPPPAPTPPQSSDIADALREALAEIIPQQQASVSPTSSQKGGVV